MFAIIVENQKLKSLRSNLVKSICVMVNIYIFLEIEKTSERQLTVCINWVQISRYSILVRKELYVPLVLNYLRIT